MLQDAIRSLKLDRRLRNRRGWVSDEELGRALEQLPDVQDKAAEPAPPPPAEPPQNS